MAENNFREALEELLDYLEQVETQSGAVLQFLRDKGIVTDENFAPYLDKAGDATSVKSRAMRARFDFLFTTDDVKPATEGVEANFNTREELESDREFHRDEPRPEKAA